MVVHGAKAVGALVAAVLVASGGCTRVTELDVAPASDAAAPTPDESSPDASGAQPLPTGRPVDADAARPPEPTEPRGTTELIEPPSVLGEAPALSEELSFAFKAGYHDQEQVWVRGVGGDLARVSTRTTDPPYTESCGASWSTAGYFGGRFSNLHLDATGEYIVFSESVSCDADRQLFPSRVLAYELASGKTVVLAETTLTPSIVASELATIVMIRHAEESYPAQPLAPGGIELFEFAGGALAPIDVGYGDAWLDVAGGQDARLLPWSDRVLLLVRGLPALEKVDGAWQSSAVAEPLSGAELVAISASPSGTRLCAVTSRRRPDDSGARFDFDSVGWVLEPDGVWISTTIAGTDPPRRCDWSPDEATVAFGTSFYAREAGALTPLPSATDATVSGAWRGGLYGTDVDGAIVRIDWDTREAQPQLANDALPGLCGARLFRAVQPNLRLPPDDRPLALVKIGCGCIDCDVSGSVAWHAESGALNTIEEAWGEHDVYGVAWLADGGAVVLSTQSGVSDPEQGSESRPAAATFYLVGPDGAVQTVGPLPDVQGALHSPLGPHLP